MAQPAASSTTARRRRSSGASVAGLIDAFLDQLGSGGASAHTIGAYRRDLVGVAGRMAASHGVTESSGLRLSQIDAAALEVGMAAWAVDHAPASEARAWAAWSSFLHLPHLGGSRPGQPHAGCRAPEDTAPCAQ